jgi:hypothetical protein
MAHPADYYNKTKGIVFSIYNKEGILPAYIMLENYRNKLPLPSWYGLKAELDFYTKNKDKYILDPTFDYGIKCDFTGNIEGVNNCRIDITTNLDYKKLKDYEPIQRKDKRNYKIVVMDKDSGEIADIFDLNFPFSESGDGRIFEIALFMPSDYDKDGNSRYNFYQKIITIDSSYPESEFNLKTISDDWYIPDFDTFSSEIPDDIEIDYDFEIVNHAISSAKTLDKSTESNIVACGQRYYEITDPRDGDGEWVTKLYWKHPVVSDYLDDIIDTDISNEI